MSCVVRAVHHVAEAQRLDFHAQVSRFRRRDLADFFEWYVDPVRKLTDDDGATFKDCLSQLRSPRLDHEVVQVIIMQLAELSVRIRESEVGTAKERAYAGRVTLAGIAALSDNAKWFKMLISEAEVLMRPAAETVVC